MAPSLRSYYVSRDVRGSSDIWISRPKGAISPKSAGLIPSILTYGIPSVSHHTHRFIILSYLVSYSVGQIHVTCHSSSETALFWSGARWIWTLFQVHGHPLSTKRFWFTHQILKWIGPKPKKSVPSWDQKIAVFFILFYFFVQTMTTSVDMPVVWRGNRARRQNAVEKDKSDQELQ